MSKLDCPGPENRRTMASTHKQLEKHFAQEESVHPEPYALSALVLQECRDIRRLTDLALLQRAQVTHLQEQGIESEVIASASAESLQTMLENRTLGLNDSFIESYTEQYNLWKKDVDTADQSFERLQDAYDTLQKLDKSLREKGASLARAAKMLVSDCHIDGSHRGPLLSRYSDTSGNIEPTIECIVNGQQTSSFPDTGARANFISKSYVDRFKIHYDTTSQQIFKNGIGTKIKTLGTVQLPFSFTGESKSHLLQFHVVRRALRDIVLGEPFLRLTRTFSDFKHRVTRKFRHFQSFRLCYAGASYQRIQGYLDGTAVDSLPDTGSDILAMSAEYARGRGFRVDRSKEHRVQILFADGSTGTTRGIIKGAVWQFGSSPSTSYLEDFYVLDDLQCDVILSYDFLEKTDSFTEYADSFIDLDVDEENEIEGFYTLTKAPDLFSKIERRLQSRKKGSDQGTTENAQQRGVTLALTS